MSITREEIKKLAKLSQIDVADDEIECLREHVQNVLAYAERVGQIARDVPEEQVRQRNVLRDDVAQPTSAQPLMQQAPEKAENFFVVPKII